MLELFFLTPWGWLVLGLLLLVLELVAPAMFFLWLGVSAMVTALVLYLLPGMNWQGQFLLFSVLSIVSIILSRRYFFKTQGKSDQPDLNRHEKRYIGRVFILIEPIEQGYGKIAVGDSQWQVRGPELQRGEKVRITGVHDSIFDVVAANS